jgi:hypothetical protein
MRPNCGFRRRVGRGGRYACYHDVVTPGGERRRAAWLRDPETRASHERERREIDRIDAVIRSLDQLGLDAGISKAELARRIGRNPSSIRRLFTARRARPELPLIVSIADELGARVEIAIRPPGSPRAGRKHAAA